LRRASQLPAVSAAVVLIGLAFTPTKAASQAADPPASIPAAQATATADAGRDRASVYRFDPMSESLEAVRPAELRPGHVYSRFDTGLGRWVWSKADAAGGLRYAMGAGSVQPARMFDLKGTDAERQRALEKRSPELARLFTIQGARPMLRLDADGRWGLGPTPSVSSVYDLATRERWEWHHDEPSRVTHPGGTRWAITGDRYVPTP
jgi:hypothetical protein